MNFIYLGQTEVISGDVDFFLQIANDLEVRNVQGRQENNENVNTENNPFVS